MEQLLCHLPLGVSYLTLAGRAMRLSPHLVGSMVKLRRTHSSWQGIGAQELHGANLFDSPLCLSRGCLTLGWATLLCPHSLPP